MLFGRKMVPSREKKRLGGVREENGRARGEGGDVFCFTTHILNPHVITSNLVRGRLQTILEKIT